MLSKGKPGHVATQVDEPAVWTELAHAQLDHGDVAEAIASYLRAGDSSRYADVIARSQEAACYDELVKYLLMVRKKVKDNKVSSSQILLLIIIMIMGTPLRVDHALVPPTGRQARLEFPPRDQYLF